MQFWGDRLYLVTGNGVLSCIDATASAIAAAQDGKVPKAISIQAPLATEAIASTTLETATDDSTGAIVECFRVGDKLRVRVVSPGYNPEWMVQFPKNIRQEGCRYLVESVRTSKQGNFYRAYGNIKKLQNP